jgi:Tfp pilus assembly protein FimT
MLYISTDVIIHTESQARFVTAPHDLAYDLRTARTSAAASATITPTSITSETASTCNDAGQCPPLVPRLATQTLHHIAEAVLNTHYMAHFDFQDTDHI